MNKRIEILVDLIDYAPIIWDVGCDHGLLTLSALERKKCKGAIISDVSEKCLSKARELLKDYVDGGVVKAVCCDGLDGDMDANLVVVAGMGGEETISILKRAKSLPERLLLQPMKNAEKVRKTLLDLGYFIEKDFTFFVKDKYYDVIKAKKGEDILTDEEMEFGRTNVKDRPQGFLKKLSAEKNLLESLLKDGDLKKKTKTEVLAKLEKIKKYV